MIDSGYAERVPEMSDSEHKSSDQAQTKHNVWYILHHGVYHPKKPTRFVWSSIVLSSMKANR